MQASMLELMCPISHDQQNFAEMEQALQVLTQRVLD
jgi:hypothetical protein